MLRLSPERTRRLLFGKRIAAPTLLIMTKHTGSDDGPSEQVLLRAADVARRLNLSTSQAYRLLRSGRIETVRIGSVVRVTPRAVEEFIAAHTERALGA